MEIINNNQNNNQLNEIFIIEKSRNPELGAKIRYEIESLANQFIIFDDQEKAIRRSKKSLILEIADKFEQLYELGEYPFPIENICSSIYRYLQRKGFDVSDRYIREVIKENAPQYLNSYQSRNSSDIDIKLAQDEILEAVKILKEANLDVLKTEQIQDVVPTIYEIADESADYAQQHNINPAPHGKSQEAHYDSEELDPFKDHIPCDKPDPRETPSTLVDATMKLGESILKCGNTIVNTAKMMQEYPPDEEDISLEIEAVKHVNDWCTFWDTLSLALKNGTDRKYRRSVIQWTQIADDEESWGKHASSSKNPYVAKFKDKNGNWQSEVRKLTREQIGDVAPKAREFALLFKRTVPACYDMIKWAEICMFPYASGLSVKLHDKLEDRSLR